MQMFHFVSFLFVSLKYSGKIKLNLLPCQLRRRKGGLLSVLSKTLSFSVAFNISVKSSAVMEPFSEQQQKVGTVAP